MTVPAPHLPALPAIHGMPAGWLLAGLFLAALGTAAIWWLLARQDRAASARAAQAQALLRYALWLAALQGPLAALAGALPREEAEAALREALALQRHGLRAMGPALGLLAAGDRELAGFLRAQEALRRQDIERWLESGHERRLQALRLAQQARVDAALRLAGAGPRPFPAA